jgi:hypothetical protein
VIILIWVNAQVVCTIELPVTEQVWEHIQERKVNNVMSFNHGILSLGVGTFFFMSLMKALTNLFLMCLPSSISSSL